MDPREAWYYLTAGRGGRYRGLLPEPIVGGGNNLVTDPASFVASLGRRSTVDQERHVAAMRQQVADAKAQREARRVALRRRMQAAS